MSYKSQIEQKLRAAFSPDILEVIDESHHHAGHSGARPEGETHFFVKIQSNQFNGLSRVAQQRLVYQAIDEELKTHVHALRMEILPKA